MYIQAAAGKSFAIMKAHEHAMELSSDSVKQNLLARTVLCSSVSNYFQIGVSCIHGHVALAPSSAGDTGTSMRRPNFSSN